MQTSCGKCGKPVNDSDVTCPHCGVLLAAYSSPSGSTTAYVYQSSEPIADAVPTPDMSEPAPAPEIDIPEEVEVVSTAPRPLFDTNVTVEELVRAAEGDHDEPLVVVSDDKIATKPVEFEVPDYAKPPANAAPVPLVEDGDEDLIARQPVNPAPAATTPAHEVPPRSKKSTKQPPRAVTPAPDVDADDDEEGDPAGERWLDQAHTQPRPRNRSRRVSDVATTVSEERGETEEYLRKLHSQTGYDASKAALTKPVDTRRSNAAKPTGVSVDPKAAAASLEKNRKGCLYILIFVLFAMWLGILGNAADGHFSPGTIMLAVVLSLLAVFLSRPFGQARKK